MAGITITLVEAEAFGVGVRLGGGGVVVGNERARDGVGEGSTEVGRVVEAERTSGVDLAEKAAGRLRRRAKRAEEIPDERPKMRKIIKLRKIFLGDFFGVTAGGSWVGG